jgi:hypothetical protein
MPSPLTWRARFLRPAPAAALLGRAAVVPTAHRNGLNGFCVKNP